MLKKLRAAFMKWLHLRDEQHFINGYNYAAGLLLRKERTPEQVLDQSSSFDFSLDPFDKGMIEAVRDWGTK